nr:hypothetical protein [Tanacetum cinerariifolium]
VKISSTNIRLETTVPQKEETFQVVIDLIKNSMCFKAFTISTDVPEIFMQQFWLKFVRIGEDHQEYGLPIPDTMLIEAIKQSKTYQMFIKYSNGQIPPKKSRGKRSQGKKTTHLADVDVSEESDLKPAKKKTASRRVVKKKVIIFAEDNIIPELDIALELGKSISQIEAKKAEAAKKVHATHARIMTEPEVADTIKALKESRKCIRRQPGTGGSSEGTGTIPGVLDESTVVSATSKEDQLDEEKDDKDGDAIDEGDDHISDTQDADDEDAEIESDEDEIYKYKIRVCKDEDEDMLNAKVVESEKRCSSLSISSGFGDQFIKLSSDSSLVSTVKDSTDAEINSLLEVKIQSEVPHIQSPSVLKVHVSVIPKPSVLTPVQESPSAALVTTIPPLSVSITPPVPQQTTTPISKPPITIDAPTVTTVVLKSDALFAVQLRVAKLEKDVSKLKKIDFSTEALTTLKTQVSIVVEDYLGSRTPIADQEQKSEKSPLDILKINKEQSEKQHINPANNLLYHALIEALIEDENAMDKGVADTVQDHKKKHDGDDDDDDEDPPGGPKQGKMTKRRRNKESESFKKPSSTMETIKPKASSKVSKTGKSTSAKAQVEEPIAKVIMDDADDDVVFDDDQP